MRTLAQTGASGVRVTANATNLSQALDDNSTSVYVDDYSIFSIADTLTIGEESDIVVGTASGSPISVVRGASPTAHEDGAAIFKTTGTEVLTHTFTGSEYFSCIRMGAHEEVMFSVNKNGTDIYKSITTPYRVEIVIPFIRYTPTANDVWKVYVWAWSETVCYAMFQS